jgi:hypothetical protein
MMSDFTFEKIQETAQELSTLTGQKWEATNETAYNTPRYKMLLKEGNSEGLYLRIENGKIKISGNFNVNGKYLDPQYYPSINCSLKKTPLQLAKDIKRRLLPDYFEEFTKAYTNHIKWQEIYRKQAEILNKFSKLTGANDEFYPNGKETIYLYGKIHKIQVSTSERVYMELRLSADEAESLIKQLV